MIKDLIKDLKKDFSTKINDLNDSMKDDILAHITDIFKPLNATVTQTQQRWDNQCQAVIDRERS
jgi:hypothetical protein